MPVRICMISTSKTPYDKPVGQRGRRGIDPGMALHGCVMLYDTAMPWFTKILPVRCIAIGRRGRTGPPMHPTQKVWRVFSVLTAISKGFLPRG